MDDINAINVLSMIEAHGPIAKDAKNTAIAALKSKIELENFIIQMYKIINSTEYPEYKESDICDLCNDCSMYPRVYNLLHGGRRNGYGL